HGKEFAAGSRQSEPQKGDQAFPHFLHFLHCFGSAGSNRTRGEVCRQDRTTVKQLIRRDFGSDGERSHAEDEAPEVRMCRGRSARVVCTKEPDFLPKSLLRTLRADSARSRRPARPAASAIESGPRRKRLW